MLVHVKRDELLAIAAQTAKAAPKTATSEAVLGIHVEADSRRSMLTLTDQRVQLGDIPSPLPDLPRTDAQGQQTV